MGSIERGFLWKLLERFGVAGIQFILQIVLARLLDPEHYGVLSIMIVFTTLANVFIQNGFNTALIQNKDVDEDDYSSVFWVTFGIAGALYAILFFTAPLIASFYNMPDLVAPFRVLSLMLFPGAFNSVQLAKVSRKMDFRKVFISNVGAILISGGVGIAIAYMGGGLWALVAQSLLNTTVACIVMMFTVKWIPRFVLNVERVKILFSFGWKLLVSGLINTLYGDLNSLIIGKKYDSGTLGYYTRGQQFPQFIISAINGAVQSVMLPAMSAEQDDKSRVRNLTRASITLSGYVIFPMMAGLAAVSTPLISLLLTDKWLPCVPFMQLNCFIFAFYPMSSCNLQAMNAVGRSDIFLKLEIIKKIVALPGLIIAVAFFESPIAIVINSVIMTVISCFLNAYPNKKLIGYSYFDQMRDMLPSFALSMAMGVTVYCITFAGFTPILTLLLQIVAGAIFYVIGSAIFRLQGYRQLLSVLKRILKKKSEISN